MKKGLRTSLYHELWMISGIIVTRYKMFHCFYILFCFDLIFLSRRFLFSKVVISLDYCFNYIQCMSHSGL